MDLNTLLTVGIFSLPILWLLGAIMAVIWFFFPWLVLRRLRKIQTSIEEATERFTQERIRK